MPKVEVKCSYLVIKVTFVVFIKEIKNSVNCIFNENEKNNNKVH